MYIVRLGLFAVGIGAALALIAGTAFFFRHHQSEKNIRLVPLPRAIPARLWPAVASKRGELPILNLS